MHILPVYRIDQNMNNYCRLVWEFEKKEAPNSGIRDWFSSDFSDQTGTLHFFKIQLLCSEKFDSIQHGQKYI